MNDDPPVNLGQGPLISFGRRRIVAAVFGLFNVAMNAGCGLVVQRPAGPQAPTSSVSSTPFATPTPTPSPSPAPSPAKELYASFPPPTQFSNCTHVNDMADPECTPGSVDTAVTQDNIHSTICVPGYSEKVRPPPSVTFPLEKHSIKTYDLKGTPADWIFDHNVNISVGGKPVDKDKSGRALLHQSNLFPQSRKASLEKDVIENRLHDLVCADIVPLAEAQRAIVDWRDALKKYPPSMLPKKKSLPTQKPSSPPRVNYKTCAEAKRAGVAPMRRGEPGYQLRLDRDRDGIACER